MKVISSIFMLVIAGELLALLFSENIKVPKPLPARSFAALDAAVAADIENLEQTLDRRIPESWLELANTYRAFGLLPIANYCYQQFGNMKTKTNEHLFDWGICLSRMGDTSGAQERFRTAIKSGIPNEPEGWYMLGRERLREENLQLARSRLQKAVKEYSVRRQQLAPEEEVKHADMSRVMLIRLMIRADEAKPAIARIKHIQRTQGRHLAGHQLRQWAEESLGNDFVAANFEHRTRRTLDRLHRHAPGAEQDEAIIRSLGTPHMVSEALTLAEKNDIAGAIALVKEALEIKWHENFVWTLANLQLKQGDLTATIATLRDLIATTGESAEALERLGVALSAAGNSAEALQVWKTGTAYPASRDQTVNFKLHEHLADAYDKMGKTEQVRRQLGLAHYELGKVSWREGEIQEALRNFETAITLVADHPHSWYYVAEARRGAGDKEAARTAYERCLQLNPDHGRALRQLAKLLN